MSDSFEVIGIERSWGFYGHRGTLDVALKSKALVDGKRLWLLCELKPKLLDVGQAVRQVKKVEAYFFRDEDQRKLLSDEPCEIVCPLVLLANERNLLCCVKYCHLLSEVDIIFFHKDPAVANATAGKYEVFRAMAAVRGVSPAVEPKYKFLCGPSSGYVSD